MSAENGRLIANLIMFGVVVDLDEQAERVRVDADGMITDWIPWLDALGPGVRKWAAPEPGAQVVIACPYGDPAQGVVLGCIPSDDYPSPARKRSVYRTEYADGTVVEYDRETHAFVMDVGTGSVTVNCATATVTASDAVVLDTPVTRITGDVEITGKVEAGGNITTPAEVKAGDIGLKAHHHTAKGATAPTTPAQA